MTMQFYWENSFNHAKLSLMVINLISTMICLQKIVFFACRTVIFIDVRFSIRCCQSMYALIILEYTVRGAEQV
jgi:hypothetical protein